MLTKSLKITGDPFVDAGALAMDAVPGDTIEDKIRFALDVYADRWHSKINSLYLNAPITQASYKTAQQKKDKTWEFYQSVLSGDTPGAVSDCRICGEREQLFATTRCEFPLSGSNTNINFHHGHKSGLLLCHCCVCKLFFLPLAVLQCGDKLALLQIQEEVSQRFWRSYVVEQNLDKIARGSSEGIYKSNLKNPRSALFQFAAAIIDTLGPGDEWHGSLQIFHFTNFGASPEVVVYSLPYPVFQFLSFALKSPHRREWYHFVNKHFQVKGGEFDAENQVWYVTKKKQREQVPQEEFVNRANPIYQRLLAGKSILRYAFSARERVLYLPFALIHCYLIEVRQMRDEQVRAIKNLATRLLDLAAREDNTKKFLNPIEGARKPWELRSALLRAIKANFKAEQSEPLITVIDYVEHLFPDGQSWSETRDVLLICLYEEMHQRKFSAQQVSDDDIEDAEQPTEF